MTPTTAVGLNPGYDETVRLAGRTQTLQFSCTHVVVRQPSRTKNARQYLKACMIGQGSSQRFGKAGLQKCLPRGTGGSDSAFSFPRQPYAGTSVDTEWHRPPVISKTGTSPVPLVEPLDQHSGDMHARQRTPAMTVHVREWYHFSRTPHGTGDRGARQIYNGCSLPALPTHPLAPRSRAVATGGRLSPVTSDFDGQSSA